MFSTIHGVVREGRIEPVEPVPLHEGTRLLITILSEEAEGAFWQAASTAALSDVWDNPEDDRYADLLKG
jgi:hypothetical protein